jgi:Domain of unknown function (DUF5925)/ATPase family associated with various cellular activities (AAA)
MTDSLSGRFRLVQELHEADPVSALFLARVLDTDRRQLRNDHWATSERSLEALGDPLIRSVGSGTETVVVERDGVLVLASLNSGFVHTQAAGDRQDAVAQAIAGLRELLPAPEPTARQEVPVVFWTYSAHGPMPSVRTIAVPEWAEIRENYPRSTQGQLQAIMRDFRPAHGGQLVLWHGEVGTGKTFALRALAWEWREWCQIHYVVDPDTFFGQHADYLMTVLLQSGGIGEHVGMMMTMHGGMTGGWTSYAPNVVEFEDDLEDDEEAGFEEVAAALGGDRGKHWRLLVLEDTGELLRPDAKSIIGQGLSRFLNVVDGLIGQGLRVLVLVTTNERIETLHPAVARPGRCAADIEFEPLSEQEAAAWLDRHGAKVGDAAPRILASLYAQLEGRDPSEAPRLSKFEA